MSARFRSLFLALFAGLLFWPQEGSAHPLLFGVLEIRERDSALYDVSYRFSGTEQQSTGATPVLPPSCRAVSPVRTTDVAEGGEARQWTIACSPHSLSGTTLAVRGMEHSGVQIVVRVVPRNGPALESLLDDARRTWTVPSESSHLALFNRYFRLGVHHIATGIDHLLFVLGLLLLAGSWRRMITAITAFTVGHSITLALATLGLVHPYVNAVEATIALSILLVAFELSHPGIEPPTLSRRYPWAVSGGFGLLHGFGFAGALASVGLPRGAIALPLFGFNLGVEAGQLAFVAVCSLTLRALPLPTVRNLMPYAIGGVASYWCIDRIVAMWS